eukprot:m.221649 g.221649  ORF g.221649 m.221649 type:complete len:215 (-) comp15855_c0_seq1:220-864(-)
MALVYALVARGNKILAEHTDSSGNFTTVTQSILDRIPDKDAKCTYVYDRYLFHYIREEGIVYLCMGEEAFGRRVPFAFLAQVQKDFGPYKAKAQTAIAYALNREFSPVLQRLMAQFSKSAGAGGDRLAQAKAEVDQVKGIMVQNIEKVLQRGEQIDLLVDKTENLENDAKRFSKRATKLKTQMWWQNQKMCLIITAVVAIIILIIALSIWSHYK